MSSVSSAVVVDSPPFATIVAELPPNSLSFNVLLLHSVLCELTDGERRQLSTIAWSISTIGSGGGSSKGNSVDSDGKKAY